MPLDTALLRALDGTPHFLAPLAFGATYLGDFGGIFLLIGAYLFLFGRGERRRAGFTILVALLFVLLSADLALKPLVHRPRPFEVLGMRYLIGPAPSGYSFPSGHAAAAFAGAVAWILRAARSALGRSLPLAYALLVGWSRIYLGTHWPSDVLAGAVLGALLGYVAARYIPTQFLGGAT